MNIKALLMILVMFLVQICWAQNLERTLKNYLERVRQGSYDPVPKDVLNKGGMEVMSLLELYQSDTVVRVRSRAYNITKRVGLTSKVTTVRQSAVLQMVSGIADPDGGISGNNSSGLSGFSPYDFTEEARKKLVGFISEQTSHFDQVVLLAGYVRPESAEGKLQELLGSNMSKSTKWNVFLALARMGDQKALDYIKGKLSSAEINDYVVYDIVPGLVYTRQKEVFKYLESWILSDDPKCSSANPDRDDKILCGYRIMEYIAPVIEDFPLPLDEYGELEVDDYEDALIQTREWLLANAGYGLKRDVF